MSGLEITSAGTSVEGTVEGTAVRALITSTSDSRITAILPSGTSLSAGQPQVAYNGETSDPFDETTPSVRLLM